MKTKEHKYLRRLEELYQRIKQWKQIGPACSEDEWNAMEDALKDIGELMRLIKANVNYIVPVHRLKKANRYWKHYSIMNIKTVKIAAGTIADIFKSKTKIR
ncbi:hypothetical protein CMI47_20565 [Candidatus Pacearchaeota archaeon]|nr:hypothetical protein [Candidatus Pacearchaeota archaeon]|tara:strand:- start:3496 stop:3798 length:303 start_codon:yes stop_codon:yes gene_type:complete